MTTTHNSDLRAPKPFQLFPRCIIALLAIVACYLSGVLFAVVYGNYLVSSILERSIHEWAFDAPEIVACSVAFALLSRYRKNPSRLCKYATIVLFMELMFFLFEPLSGYVVLSVMTVLELGKPEVRGPGFSDVWDLGIVSEWHSFAYRCAYVIHSFIRAALVLLLMQALVGRPCPSPKPTPQT